MGIRKRNCRRSECQRKRVYFGLDREADDKASPTELDWIVGLAVRWRNSELAVYYEQDQPLDREELIQKYLAVQFRYSFEFMKQDLGIGKTTAPTPVQ